MTNLDYRGAVLEANEVQAAAHRLGVSVVTLEIRSADDIAPRIEDLKVRAEALYIPANPLANANRIRINTLALSAQLPTMFGFREYVEAGGLIAPGHSCTVGFASRVLATVKGREQCLPT
jgi:putative ABC transport system substrate-binding protein